MIFSDGFSALQVLKEQQYTFGEWAVKKGCLFLPKRETNYALISIIHFLMRQLHQPYETLMRMDEEVLNNLFKLEKELVDKENARNK